MGRANVGDALPHRSSVAAVAETGPSFFCANSPFPEASVTYPLQYFNLLRNFGQTIAGLFGCQIVIVCPRLRHLLADGQPANELEVRAGCLKHLQVAGFLAQRRPANKLEMGASPHGDFCDRRGANSEIEINASALEIHDSTESGGLNRNRRVRLIHL